MPHAHTRPAGFLEPTPNSQHDQSRFLSPQHILQGSEESGPWCSESDTAGSKGAPADGGLPFTSYSDKGFQTRLPRHDHRAPPAGASCDFGGSIPQRGRVRGVRRGMWAGRQPGEVLERRGVRMALWESQNPGGVRTFVGWVQVKGGTWHGCWSTGGVRRVSTWERRGWRGSDWVSKYKIMEASFLSVREKSCKSENGDN